MKGMGMDTKSIHEQAKTNMSKIVCKLERSFPSYYHVRKVKRKFNEFALSIGVTAEVMQDFDLKELAEANPSLLASLIVKSLRLSMIEVFQRAIDKLKEEYGHEASN